MSSLGKQYRLILKNLLPGAYTFKASAKVGGSTLTDLGYFQVIGQQRELVDLSADFSLLQDISYQTKGQFYTIQNMQAIADDLRSNQELKSLIVEDNKLEDLIKFKWLFWLLFGLLTLEWFIRKWVGGY